MNFFPHRYHARIASRVANTIILWLAVLLSSASYAEQVIVLNTALQLPFNTKQQTGFLDRVVAQALARIGYSLKTVRLPAERALKNINLGIDDGDMGRVSGLELIYPNLLRVPEKLLDMEFTGFSEQTYDLHDGWQSLQGLSVSYINGWKILEKNVPKSVHVTTVRDANQLFMLLKKRRVDMVIYERWSAVPIIKALGLDKIKRQEPPFIVKEMYIYLHKKHRELVSKLAASLKQLKQEGLYEKLNQELIIPWESQTQ